MSDGVRPVDVLRAEMDQLMAQLESLQQQIALLLAAVALLSLLLLGALLWRRS